MGPILSVSDVWARYGGVAAVRSATLCVRPGEVVALFGHNGAGKSSLLKTIFGLIGESGGSIDFAGMPVRRWSPRKRARAGMALVPQDGGVFPNLTVSETLKLSFSGKGLSHKEERSAFAESIEKLFTLLPVLKVRWSERTGNLSGGQQQMVSIGRALVRAPTLLMLDEPSTGLAPNLVDEIMELVKRICGESNLAVLLVEQNVRKTLRVANSAYLMREGEIFYHASAGELLKRDSLWELF